MSTRPNTPSDDAQATLAQLREDREALDRTTRTPAWLAPAMGLLAAGFVASPAFPSGDDGRAAYVGALVLALALTVLARRRAGRRDAPHGPRSWPLIVLLVIVTLLMFSTSLGLVSLGHAAWVVLPALVTGTAVALGLRALDRQARRRMTV